MATVTITPTAAEELNALPVVIVARVSAVIERLANWPDVSGVKHLRGDLAGLARIRTGDYRVVFRVAGDVVTVVRIGYRGGVYD